MEKVEEKKEKKQSQGWLSWFLWWKLDENELKKQVKQYDKLKLYESAKGLSLILLLISAIITTGVIIFGAGWTDASIIDVIVFIVLGIFIYRGHQWAMIIAMLLWTYSKFSLYYIQYQSATVSGSSSPNVIVTLIWWSTYMHAFYGAFKVERLRNKEKKAKIQSVGNTGNLDELERLAQMKDKGIITVEDFEKKKKQILGI